MPWGVVAGAVITAGAGAAEQGAAGSAAKKANAPLTGAQNSLYSAAENVASTPYTAYDGQRTADLSANEQQGLQQARDTSGPGSQAQQYIDKAGQQADFIAGNQWNTGTASKYMNPYTQNVTNLALNKENQSYASTVNADNANATASGAFGGDRATLTKAAATTGHNYNQGALEAEGQKAAYDSAIQSWQADNSRAASAATSYQNSGNDITNMNQSQISNLMATGGASRAVSQMKLDTGYNDYLDKRSWAANQLAPLESAAGRTPTLAPVMPANYASSLIGAGSALAGYYGKNTSNNNNNTGSNPQNLGGSTPVAPEGSQLQYDSSGNITGSVPIDSGGGSVDTSGGAFDPNYFTGGGSSIDG